MHAWLLLGTIALAVLLRFWRLGDWGFDSDEIFMLRDSIDIRPTNPRPLMYLLNHFVVGRFLPLDEFSLRLLPALFGVLGVPVFYFVARRLVGARAALFGAFLLAVSGLHIYYSQFARYWTLVFMFSAVYPYAIYLGFRDRSLKMLILGVVTAGLAVLSHPAAVLPAGGLALWLLGTQLRRARPANVWGDRRVRWSILVLTLLALGVAVRFLPLLRAWVVQRDTIPRGEFLLHLPMTPGVKQLLYLSAYFESLSLPLALTGMLGILLLWERRERPLALLLASMFLFPVLFLVLLSFRTPVSTFYLVPTLPIMFIGAGVLLDHVAGLQWGLRPRWLLSAVLAVLIIAAGAPTLISQYRDGRRFDFRGAANWLDDRLGPGDIVFSDQSEVMTYYLGGRQARRLVADPDLLDDAVQTVGQAPGGASLWIVAPYSAQGGHRTNRRLAALKKWIYDNCRLRQAVGVARLDFRVNELQIYQCTAPPASMAAHTSRSADPPSVRRNTRFTLAGL